MAHIEKKEMVEKSIQSLKFFSFSTINSIFSLSSSTVSLSFLVRFLGILNSHSDVCYIIGYTR